MLRHEMTPVKQTRQKKNDVALLACLAHNDGRAGWSVFLLTSLHLFRAVVTMGDDEIAMISPSLFGREALPDPGDGLLASAACGSRIYWWDIPPSLLMRA